VAVDGTYVYWTDYGSRQVFRKPKDGSGAKQPLTTILTAASFSLALDTTNVYFGSGPGFAPVGAASPSETDYPSPGAFYVTIDDRYIYYNTSNGFVRMLKNDTGTPTVLKQGVGISGPLATDDTYLYYADYNGTSGIYRLPKAGGAAPVQLSTDGNISTIFVFGNALYWPVIGNSGEHNGYVKKLAL
jgi:hypothetical protein